MKQKQTIWELYVVLAVFSMYSVLACTAFGSESVASAAPAIPTDEQSIPMRLAVSPKPTTNREMVQRIFVSSCSKV